MLAGVIFTAPGALCAKFASLGVGASTDPFNAVVGEEFLPIHLSLSALIPSQYDIHTLLVM